VQIGGLDRARHGHLRVLAPQLVIQLLRQGAQVLRRQAETAVDGGGG
jgi:hypothetical protein